MRLPWTRKPPQPRPDHATIAVLEYELLGVEPEPGTSAAAAVGMRRLANALRAPMDAARCLHAEIASIQCLGESRDSGLCCACGCSMVRSDEGEWVRP